MITTDADYNNIMQSLAKLAFFPAAGIHRQEDAQISPTYNLMTMSTSGCLLSYRLNLHEYFS
jgi:hypothetical protein